MKSAIQLIREADRGQLLTDFEYALSEIVEAVELHGGKGTIQINLSLAKRNDAYIIESKFKHDVPQPPRVPVMMFFNQEKGELDRRDPRQPDLPAVVEADFTNEQRRNRFNKDD